MKRWRARPHQAQVLTEFKHPVHHLPLRRLDQALVAYGMERAFKFLLTLAQETFSVGNSGARSYSCQT
ncbi:hypothetical protein SAMN04488498_1527 [Mesorhizobium albiziae]|uniref:Uncharacterized protein n=1 Tax=Neomesorhizobium albiziae TaxID=335020 RepID=A0A1I4FQS0_9HYPH|nr:hypothetical protein GCM10007937_01540 [Mesorhizobium albiziae]SFL19166.1 hypothetical protein SAMN04488498_1527 [Mesorhizobium albiziae]